MERAKLIDEANYKSVASDLLDKANVGCRYYGNWIEDIPKAAPQRSPLLDYLSRLHVSHKEPERCKSLLLHGEHGTGKTAAASMILVEAMARGPIQVYFELAANIDHYAMNRGMADKDGESIWSILTRKAEILVIDDLSAQRDSDWTSRWIEAVLTERYHRMLSTIVTTNEPLQKLYKRVPRLKHFAGDEYQVVEFGSDVKWRS